MQFRLGNIEIFNHDISLDFMKWSRFNFIFSLMTSLIAIGYLVVHGLNFSVDFTGGTEISLTFQNPSSEIHTDVVKNIIAKQGIDHLQVSEFLAPGETVKRFSIRIPRTQSESYEQTESRAKQLSQDLPNLFPHEEIKVDAINTVSGRVGQEEFQKGILSFFLACLGILLYMAFRFDKRFAPGAVLSVCHDVLIVMALTTFLGRSFSASSIAAFLTIMGYSINDTVIIYDRIRENQIQYRRMSLREIVNMSISQTLNRTVLTSFLGVLVLLVLTFFSRGELHDFSFTMLLGIIIGTYSSIYVAAPVTLMMTDMLKKWGFDVSEKTAVTSSEFQDDVSFCPPLIIRKRYQGE